MNKTLKTLLIIACSVVLIQALIFISQIFSGRSTLADKRLSILTVMKTDTARFAAFSKTEDYKRVYLTQSKDSLDIFMSEYINVLK